MKEPVYKKIESYIKGLIESETLKEGDLIPSENQLTEKFNVTRMTVRSAMNNLVNEGYILRQRGVGSVVISNNIYDNISTISGFTDEMKSKGYEVSTILNELNIVQADEFLASKLNIKIEDNVWEIKRVRVANNIRVSYMITYMPISLFPNLNNEICKGSLYDYIQNKCNHKIENSEREVKALISDKELETLLDLSQTEPLLYIEQICKIDKNIVFEYSKTYHYGYTLTLSATPK